MKKRTLFAIVIPAALLTGLILFSVLSGKDKEIVLETEVQYGQFEIGVMVTGELQAIRETEIQAPQELRSRNLRIRSVSIQDLIPEGTVVDSGDWVATLDRSEADNSLKDIMDNLEQEESSYMRLRLDTTMTLRQLRDDLFNLEFAMEEAQITLEQSQYEPPATIRQAQIELEKAQRAFDQAQKNYTLRVQQSRAEMREAEINLDRDRRRAAEMQEVMTHFDIYAPAPGMESYKRDVDGTKRVVGSEINTFDLTVATLPDLSTMISVTYVNEIDISKIKVRQPVRLGVDAFPEKQFSGVVTEVANIGQQLPNTDAKVFEVRIEMNEYDSILRPSMTTSNEIVTQVLDSVLFVPLEAVHANDSLTFVYTRQGKKQIVVTGPSNENFIVVEQGVTRGDLLYLSLPNEPESFDYTGLALIDVIKQKKADEQKAQSEQQERMEQQRQQRQQRSGNGNGQRPTDGEMPEGLQRPTDGERPEGLQRPTDGERPEGLQRPTGGDQQDTPGGEAPEVTQSPSGDQVQ